MSHFSVMVIGGDPESQLAPFKDSLKVEWVDEAQNYKDEYETKTVKEFYCKSNSSWGFKISRDLFEFIKVSKPGVIKVYEKENGHGLDYLEEGGKYRGYHELENGGRCEADAWFEVEKVNKTTHPDKNICFEGIVTIRVIEPPKEIALKDKYPNYDDYLLDWHGVEVGDKQGYYTNPNSKWDWYQLGGRWAGSLKLKDSTVSYKIGEAGLMTKSAKKGYTDQCLKKHIDIDSMRSEAKGKAGKEYDLAQEVINGAKMESWESVRGRFENIDDARKFYNNQPLLVKWRQDGKVRDTFGLNTFPTDFQISKEEYVKNAINSCITTFALLKDGKWYERGQMGWWGVVSSENEDWDIEFAKLFDAIGDDTLISIYDCHI